MLSSPAVDDKSVYIGTYQGKVFSIDRKTGKENWTFKENDKPVFSSPVVSNGLATFTSYDHHIYAVNIADGSIKWKHKTDGEIFSSPTVIGDTV